MKLINIDDRFQDIARAVCDRSTANTNKFSFVKKI